MSDNEKTESSHIVPHSYQNRGDDSDEVQHALVPFEAVSPLPPIRSSVGGRKFSGRTMALEKIRRSKKVDVDLLKSRLALPTMHDIRSFKKRKHLNMNKKALSLKTMMAIGKLYKQQSFPKDMLFNHTVIRIAL